MRAWPDACLAGRHQCPMALTRVGRQGGRGRNEKQERLSHADGCCFQSANAHVGTAPFDSIGPNGIRPSTAGARVMAVARGDGRGRPPGCPASGRCLRSTVPPPVNGSIGFSRGNHDTRGRSGCRWTERRGRGPASLCALRQEQPNERRTGRRASRRATARPAMVGAGRSGSVYRPRATVADPTLCAESTARAFRV